MTAHDRFESIAGAIALGEASPQERAIFAAHASECATCADDARDAASSPLATIVVAREQEVWRPSLDRAILARIRDRQSRRSRLTVSAIAWAAGVSIANAGIRLPAQTFARVRVRVPATRLAAFAPMRVTHGLYHPTRHYFSRTHAPLATPQQAMDAVDPVGVADLLNADSASSSKRVALETTTSRTGPPQP